MPRNRAGGQFEWDLARYLQENGFPYAEPRRQGGRYDRGDMAGIPHHVIEAKATRAIDLAGAMAEAEVERKNAGAKWKVCVFKRRNHAIRKAYVVMELEQWVEYLPLLNYLLEKVPPLREVNDA
jgi:hypothetical protein